VKSGEFVACSSFSRFGGLTAPQSGRHPYRYRHMWLGTGEQGKNEVNNHGTR
jgi:hypothetical protein